MVYGFKFNILLYTINWDDTAFAIKFYKKLKNKIKNTVVAINKPKSFEKMIIIAIKINNR